MSPEQAEGRIESMGPHSDVYAIGAILYQLLAGQPPYLVEGARMTWHTVLALVIQGPPRRLAEASPSTPSELAAIVEKAMHRKIERRYRDMTEMAADLRAFLEGRVVRAYETGAAAELRSWIRRNRGSAALAAVLLLAVIASLAALWQVKRIGEASALVESERAQTHLRAFLRLSDYTRLDDLERRFGDIGAPIPENLPAIEQWLAEARELLSRRAEHQNLLDALAAGTGVSGLLLQKGLDERWLRDTIAALLAKFDAFERPRTGLLARMERRRDNVVENVAVSLERGAADWRAAIARIGGNALYRGLALTPQVGLLPLGPSPWSGLEEFWVVLSGARPVRDEDGELEVARGSGIVLVLLPGGEFVMGAQLDDPERPNFDPACSRDRRSTVTVRLAPFFAAKHELTQAQWEQVLGANPSGYRAGYAVPRFPATTAEHPVEAVSYDDCRQVLAELGLAVPTEEQWEYAARAGTGTPWISGDQVDGPTPLSFFANIADSSTQGDLYDPGFASEPDYSDGWPFHAPVGSFDPNAFGLFDTAGNVREWCTMARAQPAPEGGKLPEGGKDWQVARGGSFLLVAFHARSAAWTPLPAASELDDVGVRPVRALDP